MSVVRGAFVSQIDLGVFVGCLEMDRSRKCRVTSECTKLQVPKILCGIRWSFCCPSGPIEGLAVMREELLTLSPNQYGQDSVSNESRISPDQECCGGPRGEEMADPWGRGQGYRLTRDVTACLEGRAEVEAAIKEISARRGLKMVHVGDLKVVEEKRLWLGGRLGTELTGAKACQANLAR